MFGAMRELALLELNRRCGETALGLSEIRARHGEQLAPLLVEAAEKVARVYLLQAVPGQPDMVKMWVEDLDEDKRLRLPFNKPSGAQSSALGPVFKRTSKPKGNPPFGPSLKIQKTTAKDFGAQAKADAVWSDYFREICAILFEKNELRYGDAVYPIGGQADPNILSAAIRLIPEKETVFLSVVDSEGRWPGDRPEYQAYLAQALASIKYVTGEAREYGPADCPLCGARGVTLYPNLRGTGINFANMDRAGAFPGLDTGDAWKGYGLCLDCADLLYVFKNHLLGQQFLGSVAGDKALLLPSLLGNPDGRRQFMEDWRKYLHHLESNKVSSYEKDLLEFVQDREDAQIVLHILWATFGQVVDEVRGLVNDILPSRLRRLTQANRQAKDWLHPLAPRYPMDEAAFDLGLNMLLALLKRPGGRRAASANESSRLFTIKRQLAESIYHGTPLGAAQAGFWSEILTTARWYLDDIANSDSAWGLLHEGHSEKGKKQTRYWTLAGWIRHLARLLYYLDLTGVLPMETTADPFEPTLPTLKPYFQPGSGLSSPERAFVFLLGILYGKVIQVQAARGVNVAANALTWLKRLRLDGRDLPDLYNKVREKLLTYEVEGNADVRAIVQDLGRLGAGRLGDSITLDQTATCYFLLLGQSVTVEVLPSKAKKNEE
ncbi:TM1802 family CRISPR-associated protein [Marichromatium sp. AB31]|uniref:TM1802 family CRISPR-associated protein n=1 Tax=Marichromatium sp. AB31 TaxID=2483362 RepID=UPI000F3D4485|nr:TM1802 family CRISPR-associated protein [Marichromatium sp. AB31]RNE91167.1 CRISPR-associated protein [Marichromatium sp. AB31]